MFHLDLKKLLKNHINGLKYKTFKADGCDCSSSLMTGHGGGQHRFLEQRQKGHLQKHKVNENTENLCLIILGLHSIFRTAVELNA